jgi:DNA-binding NtrC family response regulator
VILRILIVTQSRVLRNGLCTLLTALSFNFSIDFAARLPSAVHQIRAQAYDLVFVDAYLPLEDLVQAIGAMKSICPDIHCIVIIEKSNQIVPVKEAGAEEVIRIGFTADQLFKLVNRYSLGLEASKMPTNISDP